MRRNCFLNGYLWPLSRWLGKVCLPPKSRENSERFHFPSGQPLEMHAGAFIVVYALARAAGETVCFY